MKKNIILFFIFFSILHLQSIVFAHPIDEIGKIGSYTQKHIVALSPQRTELTIEMTFFPLDKIVVWESIDKNKDRVLSEEEKTAWMHKGQKSSWIEFERKRHHFVATEVSINDYYDFFSSKPTTVTIEFKSQLSVKPNSHLTYHYRGKDKTLSSITFRARGESGYRVNTTKKESDEAIGFDVKTGSQKGEETVGFSTGGRVNRFIQQYVTTDDKTLTITIVALAISFVLGTLHAATPGHGKALVAGYLIGEKGTIAHAVHLGAIITFTHTISVFALGVIALIFTQYIAPQTVALWLNKISGALIIIFGLVLLYRRVKALRRHTHDHKHNHHHSHAHTTPNLETIRFKDLLALGFSGGITPCIDALAILLVAVSIGQILFGLIILFAFSLGLASMLVLAGVLVVLAKRHITKKITFLQGIENYAGIISAVVVTLLGIMLLTNT